MNKDLKEIIKTAKETIKHEELASLISDILELTYERAYLKGMRDITAHNHTRECGLIKDYENKSINN